MIPPALPRGLKERERGIRVSDSDLGEVTRAGEMTEGG